MRRRITSGLFDWYVRRYDLLLKTAVRGVLDKGDDRTATSADFDELLTEAHRALLYTLIHYECNRQSALSTYLFARVHGQLRNLKRDVARQVREISTFKNDSFPEDCVGKAEDIVMRAHVNDLLDCLTDIERQILTESYMWDKSCRKVSKETGLCHEWVRNIRDRARAKLRKKFPALVIHPDPEPAPKVVAA